MSDAQPPLVLAPSEAGAQLYITIPGLVVLLRHYEAIRGLSSAQVGGRAIADATVGG